jgi:fucose permease
MKNLSAAKRPRLLLFFILYGAMFLFGFIENAKSITYPLIKEEFSASYEAQGILVSLLALSYVVFCAVAGFCLGHFGVKKSFLASLFCMISGMALSFFMPTFFIAGAALFVVFAGFGLLELSLNALATQLFTQKAALLKIGRAHV